MDDQEARALGERWIAAGGGWRAGMLPIDSATGASWVRLREDAPDDWDLQEPYDPFAGLDKAVPDLRDPATRGAALEVVRERWARPYLCVRSTDDDDEDGCGSWYIEQPEVYGVSEAECIVRALEAAVPRG